MQKNWPFAIFFKHNLGANLGKQNQGPNWPFLNVGTFESIIKTKRRIYDENRTR